MKQKQSIVARQNDKAAITLLKASYRCLRNERIAKYIMIALSFGICIAAILNKYLPQMAKSVPNILHVQEVTATYLNLISGVILVVGLVFGFYTTRMHAEGIVLRDRYDAYVFDNQPNLSILKPISQTIINVYAHKTRKPDKVFKDFMYGPCEDPDEATAQFNYINKEAHSDYKLYISIQPFFMTLWIGFCLLIMILAVSFNDSFVTTLINIMIPSLSAITTIGNSWYNCRAQIRQLQNLLTVIDQIQRLPDEKRLAYITDKRNMRALADGLFNYRSSAFVIPNFLVRRHLRNTNEQTVTMQFSSVESAQSTEMPSLVLPDIGDTVPEIKSIINEVKTVSYSPTHTVAKFNNGSGRRYTRKNSETDKVATKRSVKPAADNAIGKRSQKQPSGVNAAQSATDKKVGAQSATDKKVARQPIAVKNAAQKPIAERAAAKPQSRNNGDK